MPLDLEETQQPPPAHADVLDALLGRLVHENEGPIEYPQTRFDVLGSDDYDEGMSKRKVTIEYRKGARSTSKRHGVSDMGRIYGTPSTDQATRRPGQGPAGSPRGQVEVYHLGYEMGKAPAGGCLLYWRRS